MTALALAATAVLIVIGLLCFWLGRVWEQDTQRSPNPPGNVPGNPNGRGAN